MAAIIARAEGNGTEWRPLLDQKLTYLAAGKEVRVVLGRQQSTGPSFHLMGRNCCILTTLLLSPR